MPALAVPFAVVGAAAGWLVATLFGNPLLDLAPPSVSGPAAAVGGVVGLLAGAALTRWCRPSFFFGVELGGTAWRTATVIGIGGVVAGRLVVALALPRIAHASELGASSGLVAALLFYPVALLVVGAARRAARARLGSVVASCDRREVWATLAATLGVATVLALPSWIASARSAGLVGASFAAAALLITSAAVAADTRAGARLRALTAERDALVEITPAEVERSHVPTVDVGLGDEALARKQAFGSAYRAEKRTVALLIGDLAGALEAVRTAVARKRRALLALAAVLALHAVAAHPRSTAWFESARCRLGRVYSCEVAGDLVRARAGGASDRAWAADLYRIGCLELRSGRSPLLGPCRDLLDMIERGDAAAGEGAELARIHRVACEARDGRACRLAAHDALGAAEPDFRAAAVLLSRACRYEGGVGCAEDKVLEALCQPRHGTDELRCPGSPGSPGQGDEAALQGILRCLAGLGAECDRVAGAIADDRTAAAVLELACARGLPFSCHRAAAIESTRLTNDARALELYGRACAGGFAFACCEQAYRLTHDAPSSDARRAFDRAAAAGYGGAGACLVVATEQGWR